jgi:curved DNA-binding protein
MESQDYYSVLGVGKGATPQELKHAYRRMAKRHHPDQHADKEKAAATARFASVQQAYETLSDPLKRKNYDLRGARPEPAEDPRHSRARPGEDSFADFGDMFEDMFRGARGGRGAPPNSEAELTLTLEDSVRGGERTFALASDGSAPRSVTTRLPARVWDGMRLRLRGQGDGGGDLFLRIRLAPHPQFTVTDSDLETTVDVMPWEASLGGEITVPTLGAPVRIRLPAGSHSGRRLRLAGEGLARPGGDRGDLFAAVRIDIPIKSNEQTDRLYRELKTASV